MPRAAAQRFSSALARTASEEDDGLIVIPVEGKPRDEARQHRRQGPPREAPREQRSQLSPREGPGGPRPQGPSRDGPREQRRGPPPPRHKAKPFKARRGPPPNDRSDPHLVDADACPVKDEIYKVAFRHEVPVTIVSNSWFRVPQHPLIDRVVVSDSFDAADDWIAENSGPATVVITADILLADRALKAGATVLGSTGKPFTTSSIGSAIATRAIMADLRAGGDNRRRSAALRQGRSLALPVRA